MFSLQAIEICFEILIFESTLNGIIPVTRKLPFAFIFQRFHVGVSAEGNNYFDIVTSLQNLS